MRCRPSIDVDELWETADGGDRARLLPATTVESASGAAAGDRRTGDTRRRHTPFIRLGRPTPHDDLHIAPTATHPNPTPLPPRHIHSPKPRRARTEGHNSTRRRPSNGPKCSAMSLLLRNARRQRAPSVVVVVHPRPAEVCLGAPSSHASSSDHSSERHQHPASSPHRPAPDTTAEAHARATATSPGEQLVLLLQGRPAAAHARPASASPLPPPLSASVTASAARPGGGGALAPRHGQQQQRQQRQPPLPLGPCVPGGRPAASCFCNVTTLYD